MRLFLEGNIGVGKSCFLRLIQQHLPSLEVAFEACDEWMKGESGKTLLDNFYRDPKSWAYTLEVVAMVARVKTHLQDQDEPSTCKIVERSIYSGHYCFAKNGFEQGFMIPAEWHAYSAWVDFLLHSRCRPPEAFIYLRADPQICFQRVLKRNRLSETELTLGYLEQIHRKHDQFLLEKTDVTDELKRVPVLTLDCTRDFLSHEDVAKQHMRDLVKFLHSVEGSPAAAKKITLSTKTF
jgi:deoxyadenosine/deoxycytidine kinase